MKKEINEIQKETIDDALKKLKKHRKCLIVRPTGFGKTKMAVDILQRYKHAVYMYPSNNIKVAVKNIVLIYKILIFSYYLIVQ